MPELQRQQSLGAKTACSCRCGPHVGQRLWVPELRPLHLSWPFVPQQAWALSNACLARSVLKGVLPQGILGPSEQGAPQGVSPTASLSFSPWKSLLSNVVKHNRRVEKLRGLGKTGIRAWHIPQSLIHIGREADKEHFPDKCLLFNYFQFPLNSKGSWGDACRLCSL